MTDKFKNLTLRQKAGYIWDYYKIPILAVAAGVFVAAYSVNVMFIHPPIGDYVNIAFIAPSPNQQAADAFLRQLDGRLSYDRTKYMLDCLVRPENTGQLTQMDIAVMEKFSVMIAANEIDIIIASPAEMQTYADEGAVDSVTPLSGCTIAPLWELMGRDAVAAVVSNSARKANAGAALAAMLR